jgi:hypothetical protein
MPEDECTAVETTTVGADVLKIRRPTQMLVGAVAHQADLR